eukprot:COSAG01_NODE_790_length_13572_cov_4.015587_9_plen_96_part_00
MNIVSWGELRRPYSACRKRSQVSLFPDISDVARLVLAIVCAAGFRAGVRGSLVIQGRGQEESRGYPQMAPLDLAAQKAAQTLTGRTGILGENRPK